MDPWFNEVLQCSKALLGSTVSQWPLGSTRPCSVTVASVVPRGPRVSQWTPCCHVAPQCHSCPVALWCHVVHSVTVFQTPHQPCCPSLDTFQPLHVLPKLGAQNWTQHSRCCLTSAEHRGRITALVLLATSFLIHRSPRGWRREMLGMVWTKCE